MKATKPISNHYVFLVSWAAEPEHASLATCCPYDPHLACHGSPSSIPQADRIILVIMGPMMEASTTKSSLQIVI